MKKILLLIILALTAQTINAQAVVLDSNGVTIKWTGTSAPSLRWVQASPRGVLEWFAIVDNNTKSNITDYAKNVTSGITYFTPSGSSTPIPFDNIVTTLVTDMRSLFYNVSAFNQPIGSWDVSKVNDMRFMFFGATVFNQPIGSWDVSKVTNMNCIFSNASTFNQPLDTWNVWNVNNMFGMFWVASAFNQPIGSWDLRNVTDMSAMFERATSFNQPLDSWNVSNVRGMINMFNGASAFNQPIGSWNVSNVSNMSRMFESATSFNQPIGSWNISNVTNMSYMFYNAKLSTANYDETLISWARRGTNGSVLKQGVIFDGGISNYCNSSSSQDYIKKTYGWVITDGGLNCTDLITEVVIGTQIWTTKNLDIATYSDGTIIPEVTDPTAWANLTTGAWCYYDKDPMNGISYGKLYNWYAVAGIWNEASKTDINQRKKLAPTGYHVPSEAEMRTLIDSNNIKTSSFVALPGGYRSGGGNFYFIREYGHWWCSSESSNYDIESAWNYFSSYESGNQNNNYSKKKYGLSVRCVKDEILSKIAFEANSFKIYPNPISKDFTIDFGDISNLANQPFSIADALGKIVLKGKLNEGDTTINVEHLSKGIYYIKVANNKASKFIKE